MTRKTFAGLFLAAATAIGQTETSRLAFEVASVKPSEPITGKSLAEGKLRLGTQVDGARVDMAYVSLAEVVRQAYRLKSFQFSGPDWMSSERYDIHAKLPAGASKEQLPELLQSLLAERFKLTFHRTGKEQQVYALVPGKGGVKLKEVEPDPPAAPTTGAETPSGGTSFNIGGGGGKVQTFSQGSSTEGRAVVYSKSDGTTKGSGGLHLDRKMTMPALCELLDRFVDRPVLDMTGLTATYQVVLDVPMEDLMRMVRSASGNVVVLNNGGGAATLPSSGGDAAADPSGGSALFANIQQLGLKLEQRKAPLDLLVVDHAEKIPTEN